MAFDLDLDLAGPFLAGPLLFHNMIHDFDGMPNLEARNSALMEHQTDDAEPDDEPDGTVPGLTTALEDKVFCVRKNDPHTSSLCIGSGLDPRAWKQLGRWLGHNTHVRYVCLMACRLRGKSMVNLCTGLVDNEFISEFEISDCTLKITEIRSLAPFIRKNPSLRTLNIEGCLRNPAGGVDLLSEALGARGSLASIENISLDGNFMGFGKSKEAFDALITALNKNRELTRCSLMANVIGKSGCESLARLLKNPDSKLKSLILRHNHIDNECAAILSEALIDNSTLNNLDLDRNQIKSKGLMAFLDLISKTPGATIQLTARWRKCPNSSPSEMSSAIIHTKINKPLHNILLELSANQNVSWASDISNVKLSAKNVRSSLSRTLDLSETPFFYGMMEGDVIDVVNESGAVGATQTIPNAKRGGDNCIRDTITSNHNLSSLGYETALHRSFIHGSLLRDFLEANKRTDKRFTIRTKILRRIQDNLILDDDFCEMDAVMHHVLALILHALRDTREERRLEAIYRIMRGMPMLCGF